jgi:hypothetical protein
LPSKAPIYKEYRIQAKLIAKFSSGSKFFIISGSNLDENNLREKTEYLSGQNRDIAGEGK